MKREAKNSNTLKMVKPVFEIEANSDSSSPSTPCPSLNMITARASTYIAGSIISLISTSFLQVRPYGLIPPGQDAIKATL